MDDSSSEGSMDEEEVMRNFDQEARLIVQSKTGPRKSSDRYLLIYNNYKKWREENQSFLSSSEEKNLIVYFEGLKLKLKPPTLWSIWSMLKQTLSVRDNINLNNFFKLKSLIKTNSKGYKPKKAFVLKWDQIMKFMNEAPNDSFLAMKVILIFGSCGCMRCDEIANTKVGDVEALNDKYQISINHNKNDYAGQFIIGKLFYDTVKKYISLRSPGKFTDRFFIKYAQGACGRQPIGRHTIGAVPERMASFLMLPNTKRYTGHCFRRTSATLLSDSGENMQMVKQLGRWRSDMIAQGYIENSMHNRQLIYNGVIQKQTTDHASKLSGSVVPKTAKNNEARPSTSAQSTINLDDNDFNVRWEGFEDNFTVDDVKHTSTGVVTSDFTTAAKKPILLPVSKPTESKMGKKTLFSDKPGIKLIFENESTVQSPPRKIQKNSHDLGTENHNITDTTLNTRSLKFENCTFNNCVFNITTCNKENDNP